MGGKVIIEEEIETQNDGDQRQHSFEHRKFHFHFKGTPSWTGVGVRGNQSRRDETGGNEGSGRWISERPSKKDIFGRPISNIRNRTDENDRMAGGREKQTSDKNESRFASSGLHPVKGPAGVTHLFQKSRERNGPGWGPSHESVFSSREARRVAKRFSQTSPDSVSVDGLAEFFPYENAKPLVRGKPTKKYKGRTDELYSR